ncbi:MAG: thioesterase family protein [Desulfurococcales archaeon]|nr:thioesterase family protein [Desulfurococcales archaeon]
MNELKPGLKYEFKRVVENKHSASFLGTGGVQVLSTPTMIMWMEEAARILADQYLGEGKTTVGIHVDVYHKAPAPIGSIVHVEALLESIKGRKLVFRVKAYSGEVVIGEGIHERYIIDLDWFNNKVREVSEKVEKA